MPEKGRTIVLSRGVSPAVTDCRSCFFQSSLRRRLWKVLSVGTRSTKQLWSTAYVPAAKRLCTLWTPSLACPEAQTKALLDHEVLSSESCWLVLTGDLACVVVYLSPNRRAVFVELSAVVCVCCPGSFLCSVHNCSKQAVVIELFLSASAPWSASWLHSRMWGFRNRVFQTQIF